MTPCHANPYSSAVLSDYELHEHLISVHGVSHGIFTLITVSLRYLQDQVCVTVWVCN